MAIRANMRVVIPFFAAIVSCLSQDPFLDDEYFLDDAGKGVPRVIEDVEWPGLPFLKQVSGLGVDYSGNLHVFHRGDRVWNANTFDSNFRLKNIAQGPIKNDTILVLNAITGRILYSYGANRFYFPHGLNVDRFGNTYVTDIGLHQVFKFRAGTKEPEITIGKAFTPGAGRDHLCQPTDVVVTDEGIIFVSDGYCNSRIVMYSRIGRFIMEIGAKDGMRVPHSITLVPEYHAVCTADRENRRILCYTTGAAGSIAGNRVAKIEGPGLGRVYAVDARGKDLFIINGPELNRPSTSATAQHGLVIDFKTGATKTIWGPHRGFREPHDIAVSPDGRFVFVSEIDPNAPKHVYKFSIHD